MSRTESKVSRLSTLSRRTVLGLSLAAAAGGAFAQKSEDYFPWLLASFLLLALERLLRTTVLRVFP